MTTHKVHIGWIPLFLLFGFVGYALAESNQIATLLLGQETVWEQSSQAYLVNKNAWGKVEKDSENCFRYLRPLSNADVNFLSFATDENGFCRQDMVLEIVYRDDITTKISKRSSIEGRVRVLSKLNFASSRDFCEIGSFGGTGDGQWKTAVCFIALSPRQPLRAIKGFFQFQLQMTSSSNINVPVASITLKAVEHDAFVLMREESRKGRGLNRIDYKPKSGDKTICEDWQSSGFVVYPVNYLKPVFINSEIDGDAVGKGLECFEIPGNFEPVSFVFHAFKDFKQITAVAGDLRGPDGSIIPAREIDTKIVKYNDQRWGWSKDPNYGLCPDYLGDANENVKAGTNCQFWLTIHIPVDAKGGIYKTKVKVLSAGSEICDLPLTVEVLDIKNISSRIKHPVFHSPFYKGYHSDPIKVLMDMKSHGLVPIVSDKARFVKVGDKVVVDQTNLRSQLQLLRLVYPTSDTVFIWLRDYDALWKLLKGSQPAFQSRFPLFESTYLEILKSYRLLCSRNGYTGYVAFEDEPNKYIDQRSKAYLCSKLAKQAGLKTWCTMSRVEYDQQLAVDDLQTQLENLRPISDHLDYYISSVSDVGIDNIEKIRAKGTNFSYYTTYLDTSVRPVYSRFLHGLFPIAIKAGMVVSYAYRDAAVDPFDDMDNRWDISGISGTTDYLLTYPSWRGEILPTITYEGLREGVEDSALASTLLALCQKARRSSSAQIRKSGEDSELFLADILKKINGNFRSAYFSPKHKTLPVDPMELAILQDLNGGSAADWGIFNTIRRNMCMHIMELQRALQQEK